MAKALPAFELPAPRLSYDAAKPRDLLRYDAALGYLASAPLRLAPHVALAAQPGRPRSASGVARELIRVADPSLCLNEEATAHVTYRVETLFYASLYRNPRWLQATDQGKVAYNQEGEDMIPAVALLAGRWLLDRKDTVRLLPATGSGRRYRHGLRLACLQYALTDQAAGFRKIASELKVSRLSIKGISTRLAGEELLVRCGTYHQPHYRVDQKMSSLAATVISELHSLSDPGYAAALRKGVINTIVATPALYGALAHAAIGEMQATKRTEPRRRLPYED